MPVEGEVKINRLDPNRKAVFTGGVWVEQGAGPKARSDWGDGAVELPDGSIVRYGPRGGTTVLKKAGGGASGGLDERPDLREFEINAAGRATLMDAGSTAYEAAKRKGYDPASWRNRAARGVEGLGTNLGPFIADVIRDPVSEQARAAELQFTDGALRTTSGANAPEPEVRRASRAYFRQPGESPAVEPQRAAVRERFRNTSIRAAGAAYIPPPKPPLADRNPAAVAAYKARHKAGQIDDTKPVGHQMRPYLVRDAAQADRLPKGSYVILPNGALGVVE